MNFIKDNWRANLLDKLELKYPRGKIYLIKIIIHVI